jgi:hypothetical protein
MPRPKMTIEELKLSGSYRPSKHRERELAEQAESSRLPMRDALEAGLGELGRYPQADPRAPWVNRDDPRAVVSPERRLADEAGRRG